MSVLLYLAIFAAGAYLALVVRALIGRHADRRIERAATEALDPDQLANLRAYIAAADAHERERLA